MLIEFLQNNRIFRKAIYKLAGIRAKKTVDTISNYLLSEDKIIDIGAGTCNVTEILKERGFDIVPLDIKNLSFVDNIVPILYDGKTIPFSQDDFNVAMLLTVLHHTPKPIEVLQCLKTVILTVK